MGPPKKLAILALLFMLNAVHAAPVAVSRSLSVAENTHDIASENHIAGHRSNPAIARGEAPDTDTRTFKERVDEIVALKNRYRGLTFDISDIEKVNGMLDVLEKIRALEASGLWTPGDTSKEGIAFQGLLDFMRNYQKKGGEAELHQAKEGERKNPVIVAVSK